MQKRAVVALLIAACSAQANAQAVLDRAVQSTWRRRRSAEDRSGALQLEGETWSRLQTRTPEPPFDAGKIELSLLLDLKQNRLLFSQHEIETGFVRDNTTLIKGGEGTSYNHRAGSFRSFPSPPSIPSSSLRTIEGCRTCCCDKRSIVGTRCARSGRRRSRVSPRMCSRS